jgi:hypothetical protein
MHYVTKWKPSSGVQVCNKYAVIQNSGIRVSCAGPSVAVVVVGLPLRLLAARPLTVIDVGS